VLVLVFSKLFGKQKTTPKTSTSSVRKPLKAPSANPEEISRLFISTLLSEDSQSSTCFSNELDQKLSQDIREELANFDVDSIPKIAQASIELMNLLIDASTPSDKIVEVIKEDPALLGKLLQTANSVLYRNSKTEIESIDDAVVLLGHDGVRKLVISSLLGGQLNISTVYFKYFGFKIWQHSNEVATMAAKYASKQVVNEFKAYLNGLIHDIGKLIIFKLLIKALEQEPPETYPSKYFFANIIDLYSHKLTITALKQWALAPEWVKPTLMYRSKVPFEQMDTDSQALYIGNHCSELYHLKQLDLIDDDELSQLLDDRGIEQSVFQELTGYL
jgi:hypothetical protein